MQMHRQPTIDELLDLLGCGRASRPGASRKLARDIEARFAED